MIAWVAGLFEGEGTFGFTKGIPKRISIASTDLDVLEKVQLNFGGRICKENRKNKKPHWKEAFVWYLSISKVPEFFNMIKPYLCSRRKARGEEFISLYDKQKVEENNRKVRSQNIKNKTCELRNSGLKHREIAEILNIDRTHVTKILNKNKAISLLV